MNNKNEWWNNPLFAITGLIASCIAIYTFLTGIENLRGISIPNNPNVSNQPSFSNNNPTEARAQNSCPFTGNNDQDTLLNIVDEEALAAKKQDFDMLKLIYFPDAIISDYDRTWDDPITHYQEFFSKAKIIEVNLSNIRVEFDGEEKAIVYRTVSGINLIEGTNQVVRYIDDSGYMTFEKDADGCWRISRFDKAPNGYKQG